MRVTRVAPRGFLSYDEADIDLSTIDIAVIIGENGAGKTALVTAITWCLWGKHDRQTGVIGDDFDECSVDVEFIAKRRHWRVQRTAHRSGRNSTLTLVEIGGGQDGEFEVLRVQHTMVETQASIDKLIGLTYEAIVAGPVMLQDQAGTFMDLQPREMKDLLIKLFGVEVYETYHKAASDKGAAYGRDADKAQVIVDRLTEQVNGEETAAAALRDARYDLAVAIKEHEQVTLDLQAARERQVALREQARHANTLRTTVDQLAQRIDSDKKEHTRLLRVISDAHQSKDTPEPVYEPLPEVSPQVIERAKALYESRQSEYATRQGLEAQIPLLVAQLERAEQQASIVDTVPCGGEGIYATCRFLTGAPSHEALHAQRTTIDETRERIAALADGAALQEARTRYERVQSIEASVKREALRRETEMAQWKLKMDAASLTVRNGQDSIDRLLSQIERDQGVLERSLQQLASVQSEQADVEAVDMQVEALRMQSEEQDRTVGMVYRPAVTRAEEAMRIIEQAKTELVKEMRAYKEAKAKADVYVLLAKAFHRDGIPTMILESGIPLIEEEANKVLDRMPEARTLRIETQYAGKSKRSGPIERVRVVVERNGRQRGFGDLSGGERFRVSFALRVAIGSVLTHRSGTSFDTLILDEGWGTQDKKGTDAMLESIAAVQSQFGLVLIISHVEAVIERFPVIEVKRSEDAYSRVQVAA